MARLAAQSKLLYVPTHDSIIDRVVTYFSVNPKKETVFVDPCAGKGYALARLAGHFDPRPKTYGIEISYSRAIEAEKTLDFVAKCSFYNMLRDKNWTPGSAGLILNNPPYDWSGRTVLKDGFQKQVRHEVLFITDTLGKLAMGGHQIIIVPEGIVRGREDLLGLGNHETLARHLLGHYSQIIVGYVPDAPEWKKYSQVIVLALGKRKYHPPADDAIESLLNGEILELPVGNGDFTVPALDKQMNFVYVPMNDKDKIAHSKSVNIVNTPQVSRMLWMETIGEKFRPAMPLGIGHISMLVSGQQTGILTLVDDDRNKFVVKGVSTKGVKEERKANVNERGQTASVTVDQKEYPTTTISCIYDNGEINFLSSTAEVREFIQKYAPKIAAAIFELNSPLYNWDYRPEDWKKLGKIGTGLKPLPGRKERGMFDLQKHVALAMVAVLKEHRCVILNMEMGFGKTITELAALYILSAWPVAMMGPAQLMGKYLSEFSSGGDPDDPVDIRIIDRPVSDEKHTLDADGNKVIENMLYYTKLRLAVEALGGTISTISRWQVPQESRNDPFTRRRVSITLPADRKKRDEIISVVKKNLKFMMVEIVGSNDDKSRETRQPIIVYSTTNANEIIVEYIDRDPYTMQDFYRDYNSGAIRKKSIAVIAFDPAKYGPGYDYDNPAIVEYKRRIKDDKTGRKPIITVPTCPDCGKAVYPNKKEPWCPSCKTILYNFNRYHRAGLADLINTKYPHFFRVCVFDESHKGKSIDTDIGVADQRMIAATEYSIGMTGTLFGGYASSLFAILYRRLKLVRDRFPFEGKIQWIRQYGYLERVWSEVPRYSGYGSSTNVRRMEFRETELPGVAPAVIKYLLPITLFGNITDLGYELPDLKEQIIMLDLGAAESQVKWVNTALLRECARFAKAHGDPGALSVWFNTARYRPMSAFRDEIIHYVSKKTIETIDHALPAVVKSDEWLNKETAVAGLVAEETLLKRKVLIFVEQSSTRDIRSRVKDSIEYHAEKNGQKLRVGILSAGDMKPAQRETWIKNEAHRMDALIANPKLVEVGLDLIMFSTIIFYEMNPSLYIVWQAMRRVWRLGQHKDVKMIILGYRGTVEEEILTRMGQKMQHAQLLYGKDAGGVLVDENDDAVQGSNLIKEIIDDALDGKAFRNLGDTLVSLVGSQKQEPKPMPKVKANTHVPDPAKDKDVEIIVPEIVAPPTISIGKNGNGNGNSNGNGKKKESQQQSMFEF